LPDPVEQHDAEPVFQRAERAADRALRQVELARRARRRAGAGAGAEGVQLVDRRDISVTHDRDFIMRNPHYHPIIACWRRAALRVRSDAKADPKEDTPWPEPIQ